MCKDKGRGLKWHETGAKNAGLAMDRLFGRAAGKIIEDESMYDCWFLDEREEQKTMIRGLQVD